MDAFALATRRKYRFATTKGALSVEQLWDLPLTGPTATAEGVSANLDAIAMDLDDQIEKMGRRSRVNPEPNTAKDEAEAKLALVVAIIEQKKAERTAAEAERTKAARRTAIREALAAAEARDLSAKSVEDLKRELAALS